MSSAHCFLRIENQNICHGIVRFLISHIFQHKRYISIARIGNFIMYVLAPFSRKQSRIYSISKRLGVNMQFGKKSFVALLVHVV